MNLNIESERIELQKDIAAHVRYCHRENICDRIIKIFAEGADGAVSGIHAHIDAVIGEEIAVLLLAVSEGVTGAAAVFQSIITVVKRGFGKLYAALLL